MPKITKLAPHLDHEELKEALVNRCVALGEQPELIRSYIRCQWWPNAV